MTAPPTTIPGAIPWGQKGESARGYDAVEAPYPLDVFNRPLKWALLASGYDPNANPFYFDRTYTVDVSKRSEANIGLKLQAAHDALPATGGILDCRGLTGVQSLSVNLTITKPGVTILLGAGSIATNGYQILVSSAAHGFELMGAAPFSYNATLGFSGGTLISCATGGVGPFIIGDGAAKLYGVKLSNLFIDCSAASDVVGVVGVWLKRVQAVQCSNVVVNCGAAKYNQTAYRIDATLGSMGHHVINNSIFSFGGKGLHVTGSGANICTGIAMLGGALNGAVGGYQGLVIDAACEGIQLLGTDITTCLVGVALSAAAKNNKVDARFSGNTTDATLAAACTDNWIQGSGLTNVTDSDGSNTVVKQASTGTTQITLGRDFTAPGGFRQVIDGWFQDNVTTPQTNVELTRAVGRFRAIRAGSITGVIATLTEARTAGTLTVTVFKNTGLAAAAGATIGLSAVIDGSNTSRKATTQAKDVTTFVAGDELYAVVTTSGWTPTTSDLRVAIEVET